MNDCTGCPRYEVFSQGIAKLEAYRESQAGKLRGLSSIWNILNGDNQEVATQVNAEIDAYGITKTVYLHDEDKPDILLYLASHPDIAKNVFEMLNGTAEDIEVCHFAIGALQENCNGPRSTRKLAGMGKKVVECTSTTPLVEVLSDAGYDMQKKRGI